MTKSKRIDYLDIAKGIGILLVIIGHVEYVSEPVRQYIATFHMSLFFLISGMLIRYKKEEEQTLLCLMRRKSKSIMLPYFVFSLVYLSIECARVIIKGSTTWGAIGRQLYQTLCLQGVSVLWFLPALFIGQLCFVWIRKNSNPIQTFIFIMALLVAAYFLNSYAQGYVLSHGDSLVVVLVYDFVAMLLRSLFCAGLIGVGYYCGCFLLQCKFPTVAEVGFSIVALVGVGFVLKYNGGVDLRGMQLGNLGLFLLGGIIGTLGIVFFCRVLEELPVRPLQAAGKYFGRNSLFIMVTHLDCRVLYICIKVVALIPGVQEKPAVFSVFIIVLVCILEIVLIEFVYSVLPKFIKTVRKNS